MEVSLADFHRYLLDVSRARAFALCIRRLLVHRGTITANYGQENPMMLRIIKLYHDNREIYSQKSL